MSIGEVKEIATQEDIPVGFGSEKSFLLIQRAATLLSKSSLVPKDFQNNLPNCVVALNMAHRIGADPLMVMQNLYVVYGRPSWSAQFLIATFNTCGRFEAIRYKWIGERGKDSFGCVAWTVERASGEVLEGSEVTIELAKKEGWHGKTGSKWQTMPQQMLMYRAAAWLVRAYAPELAMGLHTAEEVTDTTFDVDVVHPASKKLVKNEPINLDPVAMDQASSEQDQ